MGQSIECSPFSKGVPEPLRRAYLSSLGFPLDGMWETFARMAQALKIRASGAPIGYCCVDDEGLILQFFLEDGYRATHAAQILTALIRDRSVKGAMVSTADSGFLGPCLDAHESLEVHTILYGDVGQTPAPAPPMEASSLELVQADELSEIAELQRASLDQDPGDWLLDYLRNLIARRELFALRRHDEILATGEIRVSDSQAPYADLGVITLRRFRRQGIATYLLKRMKALCSERSLRPICSTTVRNVASQRAIVRAGFVPRHRLLQVRFAQIAEGQV